MVHGDQYFFEMNWEILSGNAGPGRVFRRRLRSAIQSFGHNYYLLGPDLIDSPERPEAGGHLFAKREAPPEPTSPDGRWIIPGEPRNLFLSCGKKVNERRTFYEVWGDGSASIVDSSLQTVEAIIFTHACALMGKAFHDRGGRDIRGADRLSGTVDLCVKRKAPEVETVFNSRSVVTGKSEADSLNIYFKVDREEFRDPVVIPYPVEMAPVLRPEGYGAAGAAGMVQSPEFPGAGPGGVFLHSGESLERLRANPHRADCGFLSRIFFHDSEKTSCLLWVF